VAETISSGSAKPAVPAARALARKRASSTPLITKIGSLGIGIAQVDQIGKTLCPWDVQVEQYQVQIGDGGQVLFRFCR